MKCILNRLNILKNILPVFFVVCLCGFGFAQPVNIDNYSVNTFGQVQLSIQGQADKYYILHAQHSPTFNWATSMTIGVDGTMIISEPAARASHSV